MAGRPRGPVAQPSLRQCRPCLCGRGLLAEGRSAAQRARSPAFLHNEPQPRASPRGFITVINISAMNPPSSSSLFACCTLNAVSEGGQWESAECPPNQSVLSLVGGFTCISVKEKLSGLWQWLWLRFKSNILQGATVNWKDVGQTGINPVQKSLSVQ